MSIAFWVKLLSGIESEGDNVGLITTMNEWDNEGWHIILLNWSGIKLIKFQIMDFQAPGKQFQKEVDTVASLFGQWLHYVAIYRYENPSDPGAQFEIFKNGVLNNGGGADAPTASFTENMVDKLAFGRQVITQNAPSYGNVIFDEVAFFDGALTADLADELYKHYI